MARWKGASVDEAARVVGAAAVAADDMAAAAARGSARASMRAAELCKMDHL